MDQTRLKLVRETTRELFAAGLLSQSALLDLEGMIRGRLCGKHPHPEDAQVPRKPGCARHWARHLNPAACC